MYRSVFEFIEESEEAGIERYKGMIRLLRAVLPGGKPLQVTRTRARVPSQSPRTDSQLLR